MKSRFLLFLVLLLPATCVAAAPAPGEDLFDIKPMADGVYAAIAKPAYKINCNAAIIVLGDGVLVVDTHSKPSAARALIEQIKKLTPKPVNSETRSPVEYKTSNIALSRRPVGVLASGCSSSFSTSSSRR